MESPASQTFHYALGSSEVYVPLSISELSPPSAAADSKAFKERAADDVTGWSVWGSSVVLARFVANIDGRALVRGRRCLELGAGCGLAGLSCAQRGGASSVTLTDFNAETVRNLRRNAERNAEACAPAVLDVLAWDWDEACPVAGVCPAPDTSAVPNLFAVALGADLCYRRSYARKLACLLPGLVAPGGVFILATPGQREGLPTLKSMLEGAGWMLEREMEAPLEWRGNPLVAGGGGECGLDHFPELAMRSLAYPLLVLVWRRPLEAAAASHD